MAHSTMPISPLTFHSRHLLIPAQASARPCGNPNLGWKSLVRVWPEPVYQEVSKQIFPGDFPAHSAGQIMDCFVCALPACVWIGRIRLWSWDKTHCFSLQIHQPRLHRWPFQPWATQEISGDGFHKSE